MNKQRIASLALFALLILQSPSQALEIVGLTLFGCSDEGTQNRDTRWNSGPADACWDIFVYEGNAADGADRVHWLNDPATRLMKFSPGEEATTYTFHFECAVDVPIFGMNLFVTDQSAPAMSVFAPVTRDVSQPAPFKVNRSRDTMSWPEGCWPMGAVEAARSASHDGIDRSLWIHDDTSRGRTYTITDFKILTPEAAGEVDLVSPGASRPSGKADFVGQFTIERGDSTPPPPDWLLWSVTTAQMKIGPNNRHGKWEKTYASQNPKPPFSFTLGGKSSADLLKTWAFSEEHKPIDEHRIAHQLTWLDPKSGLEVRWEGLEFTDFESIEWTVYLTNTGQKETAIVGDLKALDATFIRKPDTEYLLRHWRGSFTSPKDFAPRTTKLGPGKELDFRPYKGRSTGNRWPYYNVETGDEGILIAVGWPGQWSAEFKRDDNLGLHVTAGQETTHFKLLPGETVRTPLVVLQFWKGGDWIDAQNVWRRWMIQHNIPRSNVKQFPLPQLAACSSHQFEEMIAANEQNQIEFIDSYLDKGLKIDYWWMDAGWYVGATERGWPHTGTWEVDRSPHRFPNGLRPVSDHAHKKGVDIILWFEPERVSPGTWLAEEHPEWVLGGTKGGLLDLGNPEAWNWLVNHIDQIIKAEGVDLYRQDFNMHPLEYWTNNDTEDRQGITENKHCVGYLNYWKELIRRNPGIRIDACASGGQRIDLETMRLAVPLTRSDYLFEPVGQQGQTYGISSWLPFHGTGYAPSNTAGWGWGTGGTSYSPYPRRSNMCPANTGCFDFRVEVDDAMITKLYDEWMEIGPNYFGDYYPLIDYNLSQKEWIAWQFNRPDVGEGFVQAFRRDDCIYRMADIPLRGLDPDATYTLKNFDEEQRLQQSGKSLMDEGLRIEIPEIPGAVTIKYVRVDG